MALAAGVVPEAGSETSLRNVLAAALEANERLAAARAGGDPAAFDRGPAEGQAWDIDSAVAAGLASPADPDAELK